VQQRLVAFDFEIELRKGLQKKIKPFLADPSLVPMSIFLKIVEMDSQLFTVFMRLCKGFRSHFIFEFSQLTKEIGRKFQSTY
jgi:hypothetical protein